MVEASCGFDADESIALSELPWKSELKPASPSYKKPGGSPSPSPETLGVDEIFAICNKPYGVLMGEAVRFSWPEDCDPWLRPLLQIRPSDNPDVLLDRLPVKPAPPGVRSRLVEHIVGCCLMVAEDLPPAETKLWSGFIAADVGLQCALTPDGRPLRRLLQESLPSAADVDDCVFFLDEMDHAEQGADFVDLLEWQASADHCSGWSEPPAPLLQPGEMLACTTAALRYRLDALELQQLVWAAVAYHRAVVVFRCWQCEQELLRAIGRCRGDTYVDVTQETVLAVLQLIYDELSPPELVLWGLLMHAPAFNGTFTKSEVSHATGVLLAHATPAFWMSSSELREARKELTRKHAVAVGSLFASGDEVTLSDVFSWWWGMPSKERALAGLEIPRELLMQVGDFDPLEVMRAHLNAASNPPCMSSAFRRYVGFFAQAHVSDARQMLSDVR